MDVGCLHTSEAYLGEGSKFGLRERFYFAKPFDIMNYDFQGHNFTAWEGTPFLALVFFSIKFVVSMIDSVCQAASRRWRWRLCWTKVPPISLGWGLRTRWTTKTTLEHTAWVNKVSKVMFGKQLFSRLYQIPEVLKDMSLDLWGVRQFWIAVPQSLLRTWMKDFVLDICWFWGPLWDEGFNQMSSKVIFLSLGTFGVKGAHLRTSSQQEKKPGLMPRLCLMVGFHIESRLRNEARVIHFTNGTFHDPNMWDCDWYQLWSVTRVVPWRYFPVAGKPVISDNLQDQWVVFNKFQSVCISMMYLFIAFALWSQVP